MIQKTSIQWQTSQRATFISLLKRNYSYQYHNLPSDSGRHVYYVTPLLIDYHITLFMVIASYSSRKAQKRKNTEKPELTTIIYSPLKDYVTY